MTPKEKADELYWKYAEILYLLHDVRLLKNSYAKQSALIAVEEIIEHCNYANKWYWQEVKQEIENL